VDRSTPDPLAIARSLGLADGERATAVAGGADTAIWRVDAGGATYALRLFRPEQAAMAAREVVAMGAAADGGLPVPSIRAAGTWQDRPALLMPWLPGRTVEDELGRRPWRGWRLGVEFGRVQAAVHGVPAPAALRDHPLPWIEWATPDDALRHRLRAIVDQPEALLHLDYHPRNVLVVDGRVSAVLDWANARAGDRRADLARTASILRFAPLAGGAPPFAARLARAAFTAGWRRGYRAVAGPTTEMAPFYAWAGAVIIRDLAPRLGRPDLTWLTPAFFARVRSWTAAWRARAGLPS